MAVSFNLPDPYEAQKAEIARRQKYAEALQQQAVQPTEPFSYQGIQAPIPVTAALAKVLQGLGGAYLSADAAREQRELREGDIKKGQEFAAALQGAKTPEERQALSLRALGGEFGQRGQIIGSGEYQMAETRAEAERKREARRQEVEDRMQTQRDIAADRLANAQMVANVAAGARADALAWRREAEESRREDRLRESNLRVEAQRERAARPTVPAMNAYMKASNAESEAGDLVARINQHLANIESGKLPLSAIDSAKYKLYGVTGLEDDASRLFESLNRDVEGAINVVLATQPGVKTNDDAARARRQIMQNINSPGKVSDALKDLREIAQSGQNVARDQLNNLGRTYSGLEHTPLPKIEIKPWRGAETPAAPQRPAAPQAPGAAPGQQPAAPRPDPLGLR